MLHQSERDRSCMHQSEKDRSCWTNQEDVGHAAPIRNRQIMHASIRKRQITLHQSGRDRLCCTNQKETGHAAPIRKRQIMLDQSGGGINCCTNQKEKNILVQSGRCRSWWTNKKSIIRSCAMHQIDTIVLDQSGCCCNWGTNQEKVENVTPIRERQPSAGPIMKMYCRSYRANNCKWRQILLQT